MQMLPAPSLNWSICLCILGELTGVDVGGWQGRVGELSLTLAPRELSTLLWAYGKLQAYPGVEIMETLVMRARLSLDKHSPHVRP